MQNIIMLLVGFFFQERENISMAASVLCAITDIPSIPQEGLFSTY